MNIDEIKEWAELRAKYTNGFMPNFAADAAIWLLAEYARLTADLAAAREEAAEYLRQRDVWNQTANEFLDQKEALRGDLFAAQEEARAGERRGMERAAGLIQSLAEVPSDTNDNEVDERNSARAAAIVVIRAEAAKLPQSEVIPCNFPDCDTARALRVGFDAARREGMLEGLRRACEVAEDVPTTVSVHATAHDASVATRYKEAIVLAITADIGATVRAAIRAESQGRKGGP